MITTHANYLSKGRNMKKLIAIFFTCALIANLASANSARNVLDAAGVKGGFVVHIGCGGPDASVLTAELHSDDGFLVHGLSRNPDHVAATRKHIQSLGLYGPVSVDHWEGQALPYGDNMINLIVMEEGSRVPEAEILRTLAPRGVAMARRAGGWRKKVKPWPEEMDEWTHYFHGADGNPVADDVLVGPPRRLQWIGSPRWARHHDHMASVTSLVSARGRLFYIFDEGSTASIQLPSSWQLIARDAFNGTILWKRKIDRWNTRQYPLKSGPAHLLRRLVAVGDRVYVTLGIDAPAMALDAATGETVTTYGSSQYTKEIIVSDGVVFLVAGNSRSRLPDWRRKTSHVWENRTIASKAEWGWDGAQRRILAYKADSGKQLWNLDVPVAPCSLAVDGARAVFHDGQKLICLDRRNGSTLWQGEAAPTKRPVQSNTGPRVLIYRDVVLFAAGNGRMSGWSANDGRKLWEQKHKPSGHNSLQDLYVVDGLVWTGAIAGATHDGIFTGYDPMTGKMRKEHPCDVNLNWFHHRCYPAKATENYILTARNGTEYIDVKSGHWEPNHWLRGGCIYGVMPCNGLTYASMDSCGCQLEAKLDGFKALAPGPVSLPGNLDLSGESRLRKGPAYGKVNGPDAGARDWPTYRHDPGRSGATSINIPAGLRQTWRKRLGGRLSAPTMAAGMLFVSSIDTHTVHALDGRTGKTFWSYTTGGRVDSPPTYYKGLVLFGSADGHIYALRAKDGALAWRFRGAPMDRRVMAWEQIESAWPVHGSVLVYNGVIYCTAGRSIFLDGGIRLIRLDPTTGKLIGEEIMDDMDPQSDKNMHEAYVKTMSGNNMPVALSDILSCDGKNIWMRSQKIGLNGKRSEIALKDVTEQPADDSHLFCQVGFLDDSYFFRSYWSYGRRVTGGYGHWFKAGRLIPAGRILCYDGERVYGFGRKPEYMTNASVLEYEFFAADKTVTPEASSRIGAADAKTQSRSSRRSASSSDWRVRTFFPREDLTAARYKWTVDQPTMICRAMALADENAFFAGPPNLVNERRAFNVPDDSDVQVKLARQAEALEGKHGGQLWAISKKDGKVLARYAINSPPVFDGMVAAVGRLYAATVDGHVLCLSEDGSTDLARIDDQPASTAWDHPEDPDYLLPPTKARSPRKVK
jgi:outer membrane protein assembly factor BamB